MRVFQAAYIILTLLLFHAHALSEGYDTCILDKHYTNKNSAGHTAVVCECKEDQKEFKFNFGSIPSELKNRATTVAFKNCEVVQLTGNDLEELSKKYNLILKTVASVNISDGFSFGKADVILVRFHQNQKPELKIKNIIFPRQVNLIIENAGELLIENCTFINTTHVSISHVNMTRIIVTEIRDEVPGNEPLFTVKGGEVYMDRSHISVTSRRTTFLFDNLTNLRVSGNTFSGLPEKGISIHSTRSVILENNAFNEPRETSVWINASKGGELNISSNTVIGTAKKIMNVNFYDELHALLISENLFFSVCDCTLFQSSNNISVKTINSVCDSALLVYYNSRCLLTDGFLTHVSLQCNSKCASYNYLQFTKSDKLCDYENAIRDLCLCVIITMVLTAVITSCVSRWYFRRSLNKGSGIVSGRNESRSVAESVPL